MLTPDDPRSRRSLAVLSHGKPKPYRRPVYSDEPHRVSRGQVILLVLGATLVAVLILAVAVAAQEHANATRGKQIIAAEEEAQPQAVTAPPPGALAATPPMLDDSALPIPVPASPPRPVFVHAPPLPKVAAPRPAKRPAPRQAASVAPPVSDPDVDLIATILALTPPLPVPAGPGAVCTPAQAVMPECAGEPVKNHRSR